MRRCIQHAVWHLYSVLVCSRYTIIVLFTFLLIISEIHFTDPLIRFYHLTPWMQLSIRLSDYKDTEKLPMSAINVIYHPLLRWETYYCLKSSFVRVGGNVSLNYKTRWERRLLFFFFSLSAVADLGLSYALLSGLKAHSPFAFLASSALLTCQNFLPGTR